jgi:chromosome segregation ATPase
MRATATFLIVIVLVITAVAASREPAQESPTILPALLSEVKGLRAAMEQMASAGPRVQLALGRLQLQEQRVNTLMARLQTVRDRLASTQRQVAQQQHQAERFESAAKSNPAERAEVEEMLAMFKDDMAASAAEIQRLTIEEASIAADIAMEQARWTDLNQRLEELEVSLGRR